MSKVTALREGRGASKRVRVYIDGKPAFSLEASLAAERRLEVGQELSEEGVTALSHADFLSRCLNTAMRYLAYRPRSEAELAERLRQRGFPEDVRQTVISSLRERGLVNDNSFARFWKDSRESFRPRSRRLLRLELRRKGVASEIIDGVVADIDDGEGAYRVARDKARRLSGADRLSFRRRLGEYLRRRGFGASVINRTVERVWQDRTESTS